MNSFVCSFHLGCGKCQHVGCDVVEKCANTGCRVVHRESEGKLYRLDIDLGNADGQDERRIEYVWLCDRCAEILHPMVEVADKTIRVRLVRTRTGIAAQGMPSPGPADASFRPQ